MPPYVGSLAMPVVDWVAVPATTLSRECLVLLKKLSPRHLIHMVGHAAFRVQQSPDLSNLCIWQEEVFSRFGTTQWLVMMVGWFSINSVSWLQIYTRITGLNHYPLELACEVYTFLGHAVNEFQHGLDFIPIFYQNTGTVSLDESDAIAFSVSLGFPFLYITFLIILYYAPSCSCH